MKNRKKQVKLSEQAKRSISERGGCYGIRASR